MFISITKLKIKSGWKLPEFFLKALPAIRQAKKAPGNRFFETKALGLLTQCTLTGWESEAAMRAYRDSGAHLEAMKVSRSLTVLLQSTHFESAEKPAWTDALAQMEKDPKSIKFDIR